MAKAPVDLDDVEGFLRAIETRLGRLERHTHNFPVRRPEPPPAPEIPVIPPVEPTCTTFSDNFERVDGPLGPNWMLGEGSYYYTGVAPCAIDDGAAVGTAPQDPGGTGLERVVNDMKWAEEYGSDQFIEIVVENIFPNGTIQLYVHGSDGDRSHHLAFFYGNTFGLDVISIWLVEDNDEDEVSSSFANYERPAGHPITFRLEARGTAMRAYVDGVLAHSTTAAGTIPLGPRVGIAIEYGTTDPGGGIIEGSPRVLSVTGGCLEPEGI